MEKQRNEGRAERTSVERDALPMPQPTTLVHMPIDCIAQPLVVACTLQRDARDLERAELVQLLDVESQLRCDDAAVAEGQVHEGFFHLWQVREIE